jgi:hypothetical protein
MSIDGFLTFMGFVAAGYALLDEVSKLRILLHIKRQLLFFGVIFLLLFALLLPEEPSQNMPFYFPQLLADAILWVDASAIGSGGTAFLLVVAWPIFAAVLYKTARPSISSLRKLNILIERLLTQGRYLELVDVVKPYTPLIQKASSRQLRTQKLHDWLKRGGPFARSISDAIVLDGNPKCWRDKFVNWAQSLLKSIGQKALSAIAPLVPSWRDASQNATSLEVALLKSTGLRKFLVHSRADFVIDLFQFGRFSAEEFENEMIKLMMNSPDSHFFRELKLMDVRSGGGRFFYEDQLPLLGKLTLDSNFSSYHGISRPVGDEAIRSIEHNAKYRASLLKTIGDDGDLSDDIIFCTLRFFSAMVETAARDGIEDHMSLMYMSDIADSLIGVHAEWDGAHSETEFPTLGMRLIWEVTNNLKEWVLLFRSLDKSSYHVSNENLQSWDNGSIVMWSITDYARVIRDIVTSPHLPERFKLDRWSGYASLISKVPRDGKASFIRASLISEAIEPHGYSRLGNLRADIAPIQETVDHMLRSEVDDLNAALS